MKKFFRILISILVLVIFPKIGQAETKLLVVEQGDCVSYNLGTCQKDFNLRLVSDEIITYQEIPNIIINYLPKNGLPSGIKKMTFKANSPWEVVSQNSENGYLVTYTSKTKVTSNEFDLGTITAEIYLDTTKYDYTTEFRLADYKVNLEIKEEDNPHTGHSFPLAFLSIALIGAIELWVISKKHTKLYKI